MIETIVRYIGWLIGMALIAYPFYWLIFEVILS